MYDKIATYANEALGRIGLSINPRVEARDAWGLLVTSYTASLLSQEPSSLTDRESEHLLEWSIYPAFDCIDQTMLSIVSQGQVRLDSQNLASYGKSSDLVLTLIGQATQTTLTRSEHQYEFS